MWTNKNDPEYRRIKDDLKRKLDALRQIEEAPRRKKQEILSASPKIKAIDVATACTVLLGIVVGILGTYSLGIIGFLIGVLVTSVVFTITSTLRSRVEQSILTAATHVLAPLEAAAKQAREQRRVVWQEYERECDWYPSYPPDWNRRRERVLQRDGYRCVKCGYPNGFKRRSRDLHVHHIRPLGKGGNDTLANLITLCHICHRKVDPSHNRVRRVTKNKGRR